MDKLDKAFIAVWGGMALFCFATWALIIWAIIHFVEKFW